MSFPPPGSGQYPHYIPPQYQHGQVPPQILFNNAGPPPPPSSYDGYGKPNMGSPNMIPYSHYSPAYMQHPQSQPQPRPPQTPPQQRPQLQPQAIQPRPQLGPQLHPQIQSSPQPQPHPSVSAPPSQTQQEELQHQFVNPAQLFVQQPLPTAPRSRYAQIIPQYGEQQMLPPTSSSHIQPTPLLAPQPPTAAQVFLPSTSSQPNTHPKPAKTQTPQQTPKPNTTPKSIIQAENRTPKASPKGPLGQVQATPAATPTRPQPGLSPVKNAVPQVVIPAPSPGVKVQFQTQTPNKQQKPHHMGKKKSSQQAAEKAGKSAVGKLTKPPVDYQVLLLSLADEYLNAAHACGTATSLANNETDIDGYYKLVATGLGCLEAVLKVGFMGFFAAAPYTDFPGRTGDCNPAKKLLFDFAMRVLCSRKQIMTLKPKQL